MYARLTTFNIGPAGAISPPAWPTRPAGGHRGAFVSEIDDCRAGAAASRGETADRRHCDRAAGHPHLRVYKPGRRPSARRPPGRARAPTGQAPWVCVAIIAAASTEAMPIGR